MKNEEKEDIIKKISKIPKEAFDGHTDFQNLTAKQKLQWLSSTAYFVYTVSENNSNLGCGQFFNISSM